jgi:restriction system protein
LCSLFGLNSYLHLLSDGEKWTARDIEPILAENLNLTDEQIAMNYRSGNGPIFFNRINWELSYLYLTGLVIKPRRGVFEISEEGRNHLVDNIDALNSFIREKFKNDNNEHNASDANLDIDRSVEIDDVNTLTPEESLHSSFERIQKALYREIIDIILSKKPFEFERIVVKLLQKMGYGGEIKNSGTVTPYTHDNGIDGIIKEDVLGFGKIFIQAKRNAKENKVSREDIQKFVGALAVNTSTKGVFVTTADFTTGAYDYVKSLTSAKPILINGEALAKFIYEYDFGLTTGEILKIKKLDSDFWDSLINDSDSDS